MALLGAFPSLGESTAGCRLLQGSVAPVTALGVVTPGLVTPGLASLPGYSQQAPVRTSTPHSQMRKPKLICNFN